MFKSIQKQTVNRLLDWMAYLLFLILKPGWKTSISRNIDKVTLYSYYAIKYEFLLDSLGNKSANVSFTRWKWCRTKNLPSVKEAKIPQMKKTFATTANMIYFNHSQIQDVPETYPCGRSCGFETRLRSNWLGNYLPSHSLCDRILGNLILKGTAFWGFLTSLYF